MPPRLSEDEIRDLAAKAVAESGAETARDLGKVMKVLMPQVANRAEGSEVRKIVKSLLTGEDSSRPAITTTVLWKRFFILFG